MTEDAQLRRQIEVLIARSNYLYWRAQALQECHDLLLTRIDAIDHAIQAALAAQPPAAQAGDQRQAPTGEN
ncbi:MAG TPA: hypothetical protein PLO33_01535 [Kouleothrix sp.]|uniref:hypothetical protein n=1 Tax=Kouleothrix sp. TaxID=2779161 RepID=UPI002C412F36|nr:hypothetical protein [Kouleothrix sp.]HRC74326.1 hypothetical protein [Kouleothrix sp.]